MSYVPCLRGLLVTRCCALLLAWIAEGGRGEAAVAGAALPPGGSWWALYSLYHGDVSQLLVVLDSLHLCRALLSASPGSCEDCQQRHDQEQMAWRCFLGQWCRPVLTPHDGPLPIFWQCAGLAVVTFSRRWFSSCKGRAGWVLTETSSKWQASHSTLFAR